MRRTVLALLTLAAVLAGAVPAAAAPGSTTKGWEPAPSAPWDVAAGVRCDFPVHGEPVVDDVVQRVLDTHPDGSAKRVVYTGDLVVRVTNTGTGSFYDADAGGTAVVDYRTDGSQHWSVLGPVLVGVGESGGNLPRSLYIVDGGYTLDISSTGYKTVNMVYGTQDDLCARID
ncbi:hypothetical protein [Streptomyces sp. SM10]|uniref:hypothetical protein n=1 Tax=Streptomyces sp. SM10 TaxID=565556 RepID=UPI000CD54224|nr:hypothetical protein [Streptomyces sp. SM10]